MVVKRILIIAVLLSLQWISCKKFLEKPPDTLSAYPTTLENLQAMLDNYAEINQGVTPSLSEASTDDFFVTESTYNSAGANGRASYTWGEPLYINALNDWGIGYRAIFISNAAIQEIDKIFRTAQNGSQWDNIKGSAYFIRAYHFLQLTWAFGKAYDSVKSQNDLGIVLRKTTDINVKSERASVKDCYQQIIEDANQAVLYLPELSIHPFRPSKVAAYSLLARTYLSIRDYRNALRYADLALQIKSELMDYNGDTDILDPGFSSSLLPFRKFNKEIIFYTDMTDVFRMFLPDRAYIDTIVSQDFSVNDLRKLAFLDGSGFHKRFKGTYSQNISSMFSGIATDEIFLIRSECYARMGNVVASLADLNTLLLKRWKSGTFIPVTTSDSNDCLKIVLKERRKELLMRGLRWIDLKRLNAEGAGLIIQRKIGNDFYRLNPNDNRYALPLPNNIVDFTGMPQNPR